MYTNLNKPSANMQLSQRQLDEMFHEQMEELYKAENDKLVLENAKEERERQKYNSYVNEYTSSRDKNTAKRMNFLSNIKTGFLSSALYKIYSESCNCPLNDRDAIIMKNLVTKFVKEQGADELLSRFKYQNVLIAEVGRIVQESYDKVVSSISYTDDKKETKKTIENRAAEDAKNAEKYSLKLDQTIADDFYKDMVDLDTFEASKLIKDKVAEAIEEFIDDNVKSKSDYEDIINKAKEKTDSLSSDIEGSTPDEAAQIESTIEAINNETKRQIHERKRLRHKNIFHYVVENITKEVFKDANLKARYVHETAVDMDGVIHSAEIIYTFLEMVNTLEIVDQNYIKDYIASIVE